MMQVKHQVGIVRRAEEEQEEEEEEGRVREWEEGLPSLADLISLSQCLISPQLASAFSITSPSPAPSRSPSDVAHASVATFSSLCSTAHAHPDPSAAPPQVTSLVLPHLHTYADDPPPHTPAGDSTFHGADFSERIYNGNHRKEGDLRCYGGVVSLADCTPSDAKDIRHGVGDAHLSKFHAPPDAELRSYGVGDSRLGKFLGNSAPSDIELRNYGVEAGAFVQKYSGELKPPEAGGGGGDGDGDGEDEGGGQSCAHANTCPYEGEVEEAESAPSLNVNEEASAVRTLKRPRLVWTQELHKRFVDAVSHLGVKTAVPKTIMQLMNVEGLTRENVASHLQKYRLYLKRMQGFSNDGSTTSDHLFASTPVPASLAMPGRFYTSLPAHLQDINQVPFAPSQSTVSMGRGNVAAGIVSGPFPPMDPYVYSMFTRPPAHRFVQGDVQDVHGSKQHHSASSQHAPR